MPKLAPDSNAGTPTMAGAGRPSDRPAWYFATLDAGCQVAQLPENWDGNGAPSIPMQLIHHALTFLATVMRDDSVPPAVVPTAKGGLQVEWHARGIDLEVEFDPSTRVSGVFEDSRTDERWELDLLTAGSKPLVDAINSLSRA